MRVQILIVISDFFLLFTKPHFQTFNALKKHIFSGHFRLFQTFSDFFSQTLSHPCYSDIVSALLVLNWWCNNNCYYLDSERQGRKYFLRVRYALTACVRAESLIRKNIGSLFMCTSMDIFRADVISKYWIHVYFMRLHTITHWIWHITLLWNSLDHWMLSHVSEERHDIYIHWMVSVSTGYCWYTHQTLP